MTSNENPWVSMPPNSKRRVEEGAIHDLYWITDLRRNYGFFIHSNLPFKDVENKLNLKGINVLKRNVPTGGGEFYLVLNNEKDWELFKILCRDLTDAAIQTKDDKAMIASVESRLRRWQRLLEQENYHAMSVQQQMGLFSELTCLRDVVAHKLGFGRAVKAWVGPDYDKQDFVTDLSAVEVKSYQSSKGPTVTISSVNQLWSGKPSTFLNAYALTPSDSGKSVKDLAVEIHQWLGPDVEMRELFETKLESYGYFSSLTNFPLATFLVDLIQIFEVAVDFPRIDPAYVAPEIPAVKYSLDLSRCSRFEIKLETITL